MPKFSGFLNLFKYDTKEDGKLTFDIDEALNENFDKIDSAIYNNLNKTQLTNCVLAAPNGVATLDNLTITTKANLKLLIPDGRNEDGSLKNIEVTIESDTEKNIEESEQSYYLFYFNDLKCTASWGGAYYVSKDEPQKNQNEIIAWYNPKTNLYKVSVFGADWEVRKMCFLGFANKIANQPFTSFNPIEPVELLKRDDLLEFSTWGNIAGDIAAQTDLQEELNKKTDAFQANVASMPNYSKYENWTTPPNNLKSTAYTAPADGILYIGVGTGTNAYNDCQISLPNINFTYIIGGALQGQSQFFPIKLSKGEIVKFKCNTNCIFNLLRFVYAKGGS